MKLTMHACRLEERVYERQESRRSRRHAFISLVPARTVLVVIDMVPFFAEENPYTRGIVSNVARHAGVLRDAGGTVAGVLPGAGERSAVKGEFLGPEIAAMFHRS